MPDAPVNLAEAPYNFAFGAMTWEAVVKYDDSPTHKHIIPHVQGLQAVDFVALGRTACRKVALVEVKDYTRGKQRPETKALAMEVAQKVAGTLTGLASRARLPTDDFRWKETGKQLFSAAPVVVYLYAEYPTDGDRGIDRGHLDSLRDELSTKLSWLPNCEVIVCNRQFQRIPDCVITLL